MKHLALMVLCVLSLASCNQQRPANANYAEREMPANSGHDTTPVVSYADVVDRVAPAVVTVRASRRVRASQQFPFFSDQFFRQFFGGENPNSRRAPVERALGSGVIVRAD